MPVIVFVFTNLFFTFDKSFYTTDMQSLLNVFLDGILYFFSLGENPIEKYRKRHQKTDAENMAQDWRNVGDDIRTAYEKYRTCQ